ncbi:lipoprotein [Kribbella albertanoniae]|uniref:LppX_LprAFG lipoprotein n=1 Tax=Kribbella albertanoniae TaxID=1266829 RepID=A0A4R4PPF1_9ACTN|nr:hypothetical protein [Kribbella albertanoniae]TDC24121.1 hypothetical protein E1261_26900 [Kribbella albertanoniae]
MSFPWIRTIATTALVAAATTACGPDPQQLSQSSPTPTTSTETPSPTPTPTPKPAGVADLDAKTLFAKAKSAVLAADSVRLRGSWVEAGEKAAIDIHLTKTGGQGTFTIDGSPIGITIIGKTAYLQLSEKFLRAQGKAEKDTPAEINGTVALLKGRWIKLNKKDGDFQDMIDLVTRETFVKNVFQPSGKLTKKPQRTVDGVASIGLYDGEGTLWVDSRDGRPVRIESGTAGESFGFSDYNRLKAPKAPAPASVIDGKELGL